MPGLALGAGLGLASRSGAPWTPAAIVASTALWLDAADAATITQSSGAVSAWRNKGIDASSWDQATGPARPTYSATGFDGTRPAITSDGNSDFLQGVLAAVAQPLSIFMVLSNYLGGVSDANLYRGATDPAGPVGYRAGGAAVWSMFAGAVLSGAGPYTAGAAIREDFYNGASSALRRDGGAAELTGNAGAVGIPAGAFNIMNGVTASGRFSGLRLGEMLIVRSPSTDTRDRITGYLAWKWGLQGNLPAGHPFRNAPPRV